MTDPTFDKSAHYALAEHTVTLDERAKQIQANGVNLSTLKGALKEVSLALAAGKDIIGDHASGEIEVSNDVLRMAATSMTSAQEVLDDIIFSLATKPFPPS